MQKIKVTDVESAWVVARLIFPTGCTLSKRYSNHRPYAVYVSTEKGYDGFEIHERNCGKLLRVHLGEGDLVQIEVAAASPSDPNKADKRVAELEKCLVEMVQSNDNLKTRLREAEDQAVLAKTRAEQIEAENQWLKAKLYDVLIERKV